MSKIYLTNKGDTVRKSFACALVLGMAMFTLTPSYANDAFTLVTSENEADQSFAITGKILDESGEPLIGVTVIKKGSTYGSVTTYDGGFTLEASKGDVFTASYLGFTSQDFTVDTKTIYNITLVADALAADEVVVVGFATQKKVNVTGAVSMITGDALESRPTKDVSNALQGMIPGLILTQSTSGGEVSSSMNVSIRGTGTIGDSDDSPLIIVDGVEASMNLVNPNDIESISVLKDASSSAIYGSRAAFGVILITTKKGTAGKAKISYSGNVRFNDAMALPDLNDSYTYATFKNIQNTNSGGAQSYSDETLEKIIQFQNGEIDYGTIVLSTGLYAVNTTTTFGNTDWFDFSYNDWVASQEHNLSISGGNEGITYSISGQYLNQNGLIYTNNEYQDRYNLNARVNIKANDWLDINYTGKFTTQFHTAPAYLETNSGLFYHQINKMAVTQPIYNPDGEYSQGTSYERLMNGGNNETSTKVTTNTIQLVAKPLPGWRITAEGTYKSTQVSTHDEILPVYQYNAYGEAVAYSFNSILAAGYTKVTETRATTDRITANLYSDYTKSFGGHNFKILGGVNTESSDYNYLGGYKTDLITSAVPSLSTALENDYIDDAYSQWSTVGFFGRLNYDYEGKYLVEANIRYDGTSRFEDDSKWALFPSLSLGWNMAKEDFFEPAADLFQTLKLRASWGSLGNSRTSSAYPTYSSMTLGYTNTWLIDGAYSTVATSPSLVSALLTWESIQTYDIGLDFAMFNNRLTGSMGYFERITKDMVGPANELPAILGTDVPDTNNCDMKAYGWEFEIGWRDKIGDFSYSVRGTVSDAQSKVLSYNNVTRSISDYYDGMKIGQIWGYTSIGIANSQAEMDAHLATTSQSNINSGTWTAGDMMYADLNGDGTISTGANTIDDSGDRTIIGNTTPRYTYGLKIDAEYKNFDMSVYFQGVGKRDYAPSPASTYFFGGGNTVAQSMNCEEHLDFWRDPEYNTLVDTYGYGTNHDSYYCRPLTNSKNQQYQTHFLQDASYLRLKNLQVGYTIPEKVLSKVGISYLRVYVSGDNLLTFTSLSSLLDPEALSGTYSTGDGKIYPLSKTLSAGININF
ncbi:MAG: TonB-dependent receptor [Rikenellaceae bacterium]